MRNRIARSEGPSATVNVDLKWSLWSMERCTWEGYCPGLWARMRRAFNGNRLASENAPESVTIETAPGKEIRFGTVTISRHRADVLFTAEWDNGRCFTAQEVVLGEGITFERFMEAIDHIELDLMRDVHKAYHGKKGQQLTRIRCTHCGYPYVSVTGMRLRT